MFIKVVKVFQLGTSLILKVCNNKEIKKNNLQPISEMDGTLYYYLH